MEWNKLQDARLGLIAELASRSPVRLGRTALVKMCYLLQIVRGVPLGYYFTLYSYGPFHSDVLSDLSSAEAIGAVKSKVVYYFAGGYGYQIEPGENSHAVVQRAEAFLRQQKPHIEWVLDEFGQFTSSDLELVSTIVYVDREARGNTKHWTMRELVQRVRDIKPRFTEDFIQEKAVLLLQKNLLQFTRDVRAAK